MSKELEEHLGWLESEGAKPSISYRGGGVWRAHVNRFGNYWEDSDTPLNAIKAATDRWMIAKCPLDGEADNDNR